MVLIGDLPILPVRFSYRCPEKIIGNTSKHLLTNDSGVSTFLCLYFHWFILVIEEGMILGIICSSISCSFFLPMQVCDGSGTFYTG